MNPLLCLTTIISLLFISQADATAPPPRLFHRPQDTTSPYHLFHDDESVPYKISILEGDHMNVNVDSKSLITVNLNKPVPEPVNITVLVYSGPGLILFDRSTPYLSWLALYDHEDTNITITFDANTFGDRLVHFSTTKTAGHAEIVCRVTKQPQNQTEYYIDDSSAYISVNIGKDADLSIVISIVGWMYFVAWSASFYFQVILNYQRKSVIGLNFDFLALNLLGFSCYSIYNFALMFSREVRKDYYQRYMYKRIPVEWNDLFFALHAFLLTLVTVVQCFIYEVSPNELSLNEGISTETSNRIAFSLTTCQRGEQRVSTPAKSFMVITSIIGAGLYITYLFSGFSILDVVLYLSYVKLAITVIKYTPQAYMNYKRKATTGWSINNILLDFTGGVLSIAQMFFLAYNYDDWTSIFGNFTKFGLGAISISFDIIFVIQHYVLYKQNNEQLETSGESIPEPVISRSIRSVSQAPAPQEQPSSQEQPPSESPQNAINE